MKRSISILSVLAFVLAFSGSVYGQASSTDVTASASIVGNLQVQETQSLYFGQLSTNLSNVSVDTLNGNTNVGPNAGVGIAEITGGSGQTLYVSFNNPNELSDGGSPAETIGFSPDYAGGNGSGPSDINETGTISVTTGDGNSGSTDTKYYLYLGGSLTDGTGYSAGTYTGNITVNVDFTN